MKKLIKYNDSDDKRMRATLPSSTVIFSKKDICEKKRTFMEVVDLIGDVVELHNGKNTYIRFCMSDLNRCIRHFKEDK